MADNKEASNSEARRGPELSPVTLVVDYDAAADLIADFTENLSSGEVFLDMDRPCDVGSKVRLVLSFPGLLKPFDGVGTVRWTRSGTGEQRGVGVELDAEARDALGQLVNRIRQGDREVVTRLVRILVVEDNPHVAQLIRNGLRGSGRRDFGDELAFNFRTASNGRDALDLLRSEPFDAVIVDVYLPVMDGANLIQELRDDDHLCQLPVIAVSAGGQSARTAALDAGADAFLEKPMRLRQIVDAMDKLIGLRNTADQS